MFGKVYEKVGQFLVGKPPEPGASVFDKHPFPPQAAPPQQRPQGQTAYQNFGSSRFAGRIHANQQMHATVEEKIQQMIDNDHSGQLTATLANPAFAALPSSLQLSQLQIANNTNVHVNAYSQQVENSRHRAGLSSQVNVPHGQRGMPAPASDPRVAAVQANPAFHASPPALQDIHTSVAAGTNPHVNAFLQQQENSRQAAGLSTGGTRNVAQKPAGADEYGTVPLMMAARDFDVGNIDELIHTSDNLNHMDEFNRTALAWAGSGGSAQIVHKLMDALEAKEGRGALVGQLTQADVEGNTPLMIAARKGNQAALAALASGFDGYNPAAVLQQFMTLEDACSQALAATPAGTKKHQDIAGCLDLIGQHIENITSQIS